MAHCFAIQPFDSDGPFDRRFDEILDPAIRKAGLEPYRVDRDPGVEEVMREIEDRIERAEACVADITVDNPNVWYELGFAMALRKPVVMICDEVRQAFPFDIRHRSVVRYSTGSPSALQRLGEAVSARLKALIDKDSRIARVIRSAPVRSFDGLKTHELALLAVVADSQGSPGAWVSSQSVKDDMARAGIRSLACNLAVIVLSEQLLLESRSEVDDFGRADYHELRVSEAGWKWLETHHSELDLSVPKRQPLQGGYLNVEDTPF